MSGTNRRFSGKTALITHALSSVNQVIAKKLAQQGCDLILTDFVDEDDVAFLLEEYTKSSVRVHYFAEKNTEFFEFEKPIMQQTYQYKVTFRRVENFFEREQLTFPDIVVHDVLAGLQVELLGRLNDLPMQYAQWTSIVHKILDPAVFMYEAFGQAMQQRGWGRFITIAPPQTLLESPYQLAFTTALAGLVGASKVQARAYSRVPITCNLIHPGLIDNEYMQQYIAHYAQVEGKAAATKTHELLEQKTLSQQFTSPEQVAETVLFLCSEDANDIHANVWKLNQ